MTAGRKTYSQILRSSSTIGGASLFTILANIVKTKIAAILLGPAGVGLISLFTAIMETMTTISGLGINTSGVRQIAGNHDDELEQAKTRRALFFLNLFSGLAGVALLCLFSGRISAFVFGDPGHALQICWLSPGVLLSALAGSQSAVIQGMRQIGSLARISVISSLLAASAGIAAIWFYGNGAIPFFIVLGPMVNFFVSRYYAGKLPAPEKKMSGFDGLAPQMKTLLSLGLVLMLTALMANLTQLAMRSLITRELGLLSAGHFQAAWSITMQYIGFVLAAMATDYFPRLTNVIGDRERVNQMVNEQIETGLLLAGPVMLAVLVLAPHIIGLLYTREFSEAGTILRWQAAGDILKVAGWPMGFILIAREERKLFFMTQSAWHVSYILLVWIGMDYFNLAITGIAFFACYLLGFILNTIITRRIIQFRFSRYNAGLLAIQLALAISMLALSFYDESMTLVIGLSAVAVLAVYGMRRLMSHTRADGRAGNWLRNPPDPENRR